MASTIVRFIASLIFSQYRVQISGVTGWVFKLVFRCCVFLSTPLFIYAFISILQWLNSIHPFFMVLTLSLLTMKITISLTAKKYSYHCESFSRALLSISIVGIVLGIVDQINALPQSVKYYIYFSISVIASFIGEISVLIIGKSLRFIGKIFKTLFLSLYSFILAPVKEGQKNSINNLASSKIPSDIVANEHINSRVSENFSNTSNNFYKSREWRQLRYSVIRKYGRVCAACGGSSKTVHVDHIKPRSLYPEFELDIENLQVLCEDCNLGKSNHYVDDWRNH